MKIIGLSISNRHAVLAVSLLVIVLGIRAFVSMPTDLFPDTSPPLVSIVTVLPGARARDITDKITRVLEKELSSIPGLVNLTSSTRDEVSAISAEFDYEKSIADAVVDAQNAVSRVKADLPDGTMESRIQAVTDATRPLLTISMSPNGQNGKSLTEIRLLAENDLRDEFLSIPGIADVDIFGGHRPEIEILADPVKLLAHEITMTDLVEALAQENVSRPAGILESAESERLVRVSGEFSSLSDIRDLPVRKAGSGILHVHDLAEVTLSEEKPRSIYHGNGKAAIAVNLLRPPGGETVRAIEGALRFLPGLKRRYPDIDFAITYNQKPLIDLNVNGMTDTLLQAIVLTIVVILIFLGAFRAAAVVSASIPLAFLASITVLNTTPNTLNMVTLSGLIISIGMVVDAAVVVLENIFRHRDENPGADEGQTILSGASEVSGAVVAGVLTTIIVLVPVMFSGGYTEQTMRPLSLVIILTLTASLVAALTIIPGLLVGHLEDKGTKNRLTSILFGWVDPLLASISGFFSDLLNLALRFKFLTIIITLAFTGFTMNKVKPLNGQELMPRMDTGIAVVEFDTPSDFSSARVEQIMTRLEKFILSGPYAISTSATAGSEPGQMSFGGGGASLQSIKVTVNLVPRTERKETIWEIMDTWRGFLDSLPEIKGFRVVEYGATPVSTTKAPIDVVIHGNDPLVLDELADKVMAALEGTKGLADLRRSWHLDKTSETVVVDPVIAREFGVNPSKVGMELTAAIRGIQATRMRLSGFLDIPVRVRYMGEKIVRPEDLGAIYIPTRHGMMPLRTLGRVDSETDQPVITREKLRYTVDVTGINRGLTVAHVSSSVTKRLESLELPAGHGIEIAGTIADMSKGGKEMGGALLTGIILLYFLLVILYRSFSSPLAIMSALPPAVAVGFWGLLLFDKPMCKPAMMGLILLCGTLVNNGILLLEFIEEARKRGDSLHDALTGSIRLRLRPILMTTVSTVAGLSPLMAEQAVGLERMSPLSIVAATGLMGGTLLTLILVPVVYALFDEMGKKFSI